MQKSVTVLTKGTSWLTGTIFSKTFVVNILAALYAILEAQEVVNLIPADMMGYYAAAVLAINVILRQFTNAPITNSPGEKKVG